MSLLSNTAVAFSMSADAFAASIGKGAAMSRPGLFQALRVGIVFGTVEAVTPIIGWCLGSTAGDYIQEADHWVAFGVLACIGAHMIHEGMKAESPEEDAPQEEEPASKSKRGSRLGRLALTAFGTSIDAMAAGAAMALLEVNILALAAMIGGATFFMSTLGVLTGRFLGAKAGKRAEIFGGVCLILVGAKILIEHLSA